METMGAGAAGEDKYCSELKLIPTQIPLYIVPLNYVRLIALGYIASLGKFEEFSLSHAA